MSQFKPLSEKIANKMITDLKTGNSIFQRPNNSMNSALPFNIESGNKYTGPSALVLLMQKRDDPRWATSNQANRNHTAVIKGSTGTFISFMSSYEIQKVFDQDGKPVLKENGNQRTERVKLDQPKEVDACLFNGEQLRKLPKWEKEPSLLSPAERAQFILDNSKAVIEHGGDDMFYETLTDTIVLPEMQQFANPEQYYAEAIHQLAHWTSAENRLNRPQQSSMDQLSHIREELRTNLASLFLSKELNLPYDLNDHVGYVASWGQILKDEPGELFKAAGDAQKIVDHILAFEQKQEIKEDAEAVQEMESGQETGAQPEQDTVKYNTDKLTKGEVIPHNGTEFKVLSDLKNKAYQMQDLSDGRKFKMGMDSGLYASLLEARNNSQEMVTQQQFEQSERVGEERDYEINNDAADEIDNSYQMQR